MSITEPLSFTIMVEKKLALIHQTALALMMRRGFSDLTRKIKLLVLNANKKFLKDLVLASISMRRLILLFMNMTEQLNGTIMAEKKLSLIHQTALALMKRRGISDLNQKIKLLELNVNTRLPRGLVLASINLKKVILMFIKITEQVSFTIVAAKKLFLIQQMALAYMKRRGNLDSTQKIKLFVSSVNTEFL